MRAAIIENGIVVNVIEVEDLNFLPNLIEADENAEIDGTYKNGKFNRYKPIATAEENKKKALELLKETEWLVASDVADKSIANPYLENQSEFIAWRNQVRAIAINPIDGNIDLFNEIPKEVWKSV